MNRKRWCIVFLIFGVIVAGALIYGRLSRTSGAPPGAVLVDLGHDPLRVRWSKNGRYLYYGRDAQHGVGLYRYVLKSRKTEDLKVNVGLHEYDISPDDRSLAICKDGTLAIYDLATARARRLNVPCSTVRICWVTPDIIAFEDLPTGTVVVRPDGKWRLVKGLAPTRDGGHGLREGASALSVFPSCSTDALLHELEQTNRQQMYRYLYLTRNVAAYHTSTYTYEHNSLQIVNLHTLQRITLQLPGLEGVGHMPIYDAHFSPDLTKYYLVNLYRGSHEDGLTDGIWICDTPPKALAKLRRVIDEAHSDAKR